MNILLAGDSTVTDRGSVQAYDPKVCYTGWGQILPRYIKESAKVLNFAVSGYTVESFEKEGKYAELVARLHAGDYVLIQFGHNDQKVTHLRADSGYAKWLEKYIREIRDRYGNPVLVTSVARNSWRGDNGQYSDLLLPYANAMKKAAREQCVPLIDLHDATVRWTMALSRKGAKRFYHPGDYTHTNDYGADRWVRFVLELVLESKDPSLDRLKEQIIPMEAWQPLTFASGKRFVQDWTAAPAARTDFAAWNNHRLLTYADALEMAKQGYGYFVSEDTEAEDAFCALAAAKENGYLPASLDRCEDLLASVIPCALFESIMLLACKGRNALPDEAMHIPIKMNDDGTVSGADAVAYALRLEQLTTGAIGGRQPNDEAPQGS